MYRLLPLLCSVQVSELQPEPLQTLSSASLQQALQLVMLAPMLAAAATSVKLAPGSCRVMAFCVVGSDIES